MQGLTDESVGSTFSTDALRTARDKTLEVIQEVANRVRPGMTEKQARKLLQEIQSEMGGPKSWHPPQIRFGVNTLLAFGQTGETTPALAENDIFFLDIGPIFEDHEGDVGRCFTLGSDPEMVRCAKDVEEIWWQVRNEWAEKGSTGAELYTFAAECAKTRGWVLSLNKANGHRVADFPHTARRRGSVEGLMGKPASDRWILEIQIRHPERPFGAFYEDLLN